ncbi:MAG: DUF89 family protein [Ruminococcaceae bacterium]|nr:DUF89 family protein [Oscillospiraceae bacterium]
MRIGVDCIKCQFDRQYRLAATKNDPEKQDLFIKDVCRIIAEAPPEWPSPVFTPLFGDAFAKHFGYSDRFADIKKRSNEYVLAIEEDLKKRIDSADDHILMALKLARAGNYIDFGALGNTVNDAQLNALISEAADQPVDMTEFNRMLNELNTAKSLVYLADNAGELVMDKLLISEIKKAYPDLDVTLAVRGYPVLNDATLEDCRQVGIDKIANAMSNGSHVAGTYIPDISAELREKLLSADVIISKGQGNFETLSGSGLNIYYVFLCKCQLFCRIFDVPQLTGMLLNERRIKID